MKSWACAAGMLVTMLAAMLGVSRADTIRLKDGTVISAINNVTEKDGQVHYTAGGVPHSVPKSSVSGIEHGDRLRPGALGITIGTSKSRSIRRLRTPVLAVRSPGLSPALSPRSRTASSPRRCPGRRRCAA